MMKDITAGSYSPCKLCRHKYPKNVEPDMSLMFKAHVSFPLSDGFAKRYLSWGPRKGLRQDSRDCPPPGSEPMNTRKLGHKAK
jgi:hypothetical protein